jgi:hypothetical protein
MPPAGPAVTRRALLGAAAAGAALVACGGGGGGPDTEPAATATADRAAIDDAVTAERTLLAGYDALLAAGTADPALAQARAEHAAHLSALLERRYPSSAPSASPPTLADVPTGHDLAAAERASVAELQAAATAAVDGDTAAVLASVAASHAVSASGAAA